MTDVIVLGGVEVVELTTTETVVLEGVTEVIELADQSVVENLITDTVVIDGESEILVLASEPTLEILEVGIQGPTGAQGASGGEDEDMSYRRLVDEVADSPSSGDTTYYTGWSSPGAGGTDAAVWKIRKVVVDSSGDITESGFADGNLNYDNVYDDRASLSYS